MKKTNKGIKCNYCGEVFGKVGIKRHLEKCKIREEKKSAWRRGILLDPGSGLLSEGILHVFGCIR